MLQGRNIISKLSLFSCSVVMAVSVGCVSSNQPRWSNQTQTGIPPVAQQPRRDQTANKEASPRTSLAAVAAFLERTADYNAADTTSVSTKPSDVHPQVSATDRNLTGSVPTTPAQIEPPSGSRNQPWRASANAEMSVIEQQQPPVAVKAPTIRSVSIEPPKTLSQPATEDPQVNTTNQALAMKTGDSADLESTLFSRLTDKWNKARDFDSEWRLRWTQIAFGKDGDALRVPSDLPQEAASLFTALIRTVATIRSAIRNPVLPADEAVARVEELQHLLAEHADPVITTVQLCQKVVTYGVYDPLEPANLVAGRPNQAIVYVEVKNFRSEKTSDDRFRTALATRLEVLTTDGKSVWEHEEPEIEDHCRRQRTDFFIAQRIALPPTLLPGDYVLKVLVDDRLAGRADEASYRFTLHAATSLAGTP